MENCEGAGGRWETRMPRPVRKAEDGAPLLYALAFETRADARGGGEAQAAGSARVQRRGPMAASRISEPPEQLTELGKFN